MQTDILETGVLIAAIPIGIRTRAAPPDMPRQNERAKYFDDYGLRLRNPGQSRITPIDYSALAVDARIHPRPVLDFIAECCSI
jgi:hypothetical protein